MKVLVIIPAYNEEANILNTCKEISKLKIKGYKIDYVVINDASIDNTKQVCLNSGLNLIDLPCNLGIGGAVQTGYKYAYYKDYDVAIQFDGDGQHNASYIDDLLKAISAGNDLVIGSRYISELNEFRSTAMRRFGSNILRWLIKICSNISVTDPTSGFRACSKEVIKEFAKDYPIDYPEPETVASIAIKGYKVKEIPVEMNERTGGTSSINALKSIYYMIKVGLAIIFISLFTKGEDK